jgi:methylase of polypeptide subunit release factors
MGGMLTARQCADLRDLFVAYAYTVDAVIAAIGEPAHRALGRNATVPGVRALGDRVDPLATLIRMWLLQRSVPVGQLEQALPGLVRPLIEAGFAGSDGSRSWARADIRPYATDHGALWLCADLTPGLDSSVTPMRPDFVLGASSASSSLAHLTVRQPVQRALDLGTGCGVQSLHLAQHAASTVATDLNPRALALAELTFRLNDVTVDLRLGDLFAPVADERFDLITSNPPYVMSPPSDGPRLAYREGSRRADRLVEDIIRAGPRHLADDGIMQVLCNWAHPVGGSWEDRLAGWITPGGCDAHVVQREVLDPSAYAELWLADAGLTRSPDYRQRYAEWLDYFAAEGIEAVGLGWIVLHQAGREKPEVTLEHWPYGIEQPIAPAIEARLGAVDRDRSMSDAAVLARVWALADDVLEESTGTPGAADPQHIVLRQHRGFRRAVEVDTALAGIMGACDGDLPLGMIVDAVARLMDAEPDDLRADILPRFRRLVMDGFVH